MTEQLPSPDLQLDSVEPREQTRQALEERHLEHPDTDHELQIETSVLHNEGDRLEATFSCEACSVSVTEVYTLRHIENVDSGERYARDNTPTCDCNGTEKNGRLFQETRRTKPRSGTAIAESQCGWCGTKYRDVFKYQRLR